MRETGVREKVEKGEEEREEDELKAQRERDNETMRERERNYRTKTQEGYLANCNHFANIAHNLHYRLFNSSIITAVF